MKVATSLSKVAFGILNKMFEEKIKELEAEQRDLIAAHQAKQAELNAIAQDILRNDGALKMLKELAQKKVEKKV
jgi:dephospho-CoA kinase